MIRGCWIVHPETGELIPKSEYQRPPVARSHLPCPMVLRDIEPYQSQIDGSIITSRSQHRDHLKSHGMVELGNDLPEGPKHESALTPEAISEAYDQLEAGYHPTVSEKPPAQWEGSIEGND